MDEGDYLLTVDGHLGGLTVASQYGKVVCVMGSAEEVLAAVAAHMDEQQFWPAVWWISDHGNYWQIDLDGNEIKEEDAHGYAS